MIGLSTTCYATRGYSVYKSIEKIVELGFDTVEIGAAHTFEENIWKTLKKVRKDFKHINFTVHTLFPPRKHKTWFNPADGLNRVNKEIIDNLFEAAGCLNASFISIHPAIFNEVRLGLRGKGNYYKPAVGKQKDKNDCILKFKNLMWYASEKAALYGITLLLENLDATFAKSYPYSSHDFLDIFKELPNIGLLLDVEHALDCGNLLELLELRSYIHEVHMHDSDKDYNNEKNCHLSIKNEFYFYPFKKLMLNKSIVLIFEHGADVSEDEIRFEKRLLEQFIDNNEYQKD